MRRGTTVAYKETFLLVGGEKIAWQVCYNSVYKYVASSEDWERLPARLDSPRGGVTAMLVPQNHFCPCPIMNGTCKFPFIYSGYTYETCLKVSDNLQFRSWCPPVAVETKEDSRQWYNCSADCPSTGESHI